MWFAADEKKIARSLGGWNSNRDTSWQRKQKTNRAHWALLESANDMRASGLMSKAAHEKITMRHLGKRRLPYRQNFHPAKFAR